MKWKLFFQKEHSHFFKKNLVGSWLFMACSFEFEHILEKLVLMNDNQYQKIFLVSHIIDFFCLIFTYMRKDVCI